MISVLLGLLSILCRVPVGRAVSWKNSSYLHSRFGGDRGEGLPKGSFASSLCFGVKFGTRRTCWGRRGWIDLQELVRG